MTTFNNFPNQVYAATLTGSNGITVTGSLSPYQIITRLDPNLFTVDSDNIGIDISPTEKLHVNGNVRADGIRFDSSGELLSDYEEGTFSPYFFQTGNGDTPSQYSYYSGGQVGRYVKIGRTCYFTIELGLTASAALPSPTTGSLRIGGLPFASDNDTYYSVTCGTYANFLTSLTSAPMGYMGPNGTSIFPRQEGAGNPVSLTNNDLTTTSYMIWAGTYKTAT